MEEKQIMGGQLTFTTPSLHKVTIREQNGSDDDLLSNRGDAKELRNLSNLISAIVIASDYTKNGTLTPEEAHDLPALDRYAILMNSRILSIGEILEFQHTWEDGNTVFYSQDLNEFLLDYANLTEEELNKKPNAIPAYPEPEKKVIDVFLKSGKHISFERITGRGEGYLLSLPIHKESKNQALIARKLKLEVNGVMEEVHSFHLFTKKDIIEIRKLVSTYDPTFFGITDIENPNTGEVTSVATMGIQGFFYPEEI